MVVNNLNIRSAFGGPNEAHAPLIVDADAVLTFAIPLQRLQFITWRHAQILQNCRPVKLFKFAKCGALNVYPSANALAEKERLRLLAFKALYCHVLILTQRSNNVKRYYFL
jgi:hypothetical protein